MPTIRTVDPTTATGRTREIFDVVLRRESTVFDAESVSNIWRCMGHSPALLEASRNRPRALTQITFTTPNTLSEGMQIESDIRPSAYAASRFARASAAPEDR